MEGGAPRELLENVTLADWTPDGRDLAVVHKVGGSNRIEFPIGKVLYETASGIESMRFSPQGDRLAISPYFGDILCIDLAGKTTTVSKGWPYIGNLAWRADGREIWFGGHKGSEKYAVYAVTLSGRERLVREETGGIYFHDVSKDGRVLLNDYFWNASLVALTGGAGAERDLPWMDRSAVADIGHDGREVLFTEWGEGGGGKKTAYLRAVDASAAVRLGDGWALALSPDGRWALTRPSEPSDPYVLLPTGPGQPKKLEHRGLTTVDTERFLPDGKGFLFLARAGNNQLKAYVQSLDGGEPRAVSPEALSVGSFAELSVGGVAVSPDGRFFAALGPDAKIAIHPMDGGNSKPLGGAESDEIPILWSADGRSIYVFKVKEAPAMVFRLDVATGARELWKTVAPADRSGLVAIDGIVITPDARSYAYCYERILTSLQVVEGLR
jgi:Tol biopolymer transport system component